ncbi:DNA repair protein Rad50, partial [Campylobacter coli]|nr:DNA repair protein Rad50 [Campylobacter jejuni]EAL5256338.1 DNA repair protein Rad50 [Campylobacter coli]
SDPNKRKNFHEELKNKEILTD